LRSIGNIFDHLRKRLSIAMRQQKCPAMQGVSGSDSGKTLPPPVPPRSLDICSSRHQVVARTSTLDVHPEGPVRKPKRIVPIFRPDPVRQTFMRIAFVFAGLKAEQACLSCQTVSVRPLCESPRSPWFQGIRRKRPRPIRVRCRIACIRQTAPQNPCRHNLA